MRTEMPVFKRCCFCLPLRRSLIAWGYFKLIFASLMLVYCLVVLYTIIMMFLHVRRRVMIEEIIVLTVVLSIVIVDIILHILFVIGAHKKEVKFFKVYYYYSLILLVLTLLLDLVWVGLSIQYNIYRYIDILTFSAWAVMFLNLLIQAYVILLVRSEIIKLNDIGSFRFVNNAAEAECKLQIEYPSEKIHEDDKVVDKKDLVEKDTKEEIEISTNPEDSTVNIVS